MKKDFDDIANISWYKTNRFTHYTNSNLASIYIGEAGQRKYLRLKMSYTGSDWIFFERAYLSYDGNTREIRFNKYDDKKTENSGGSVWEWIDVKVDQTLYQWLQEFANANKPKMRLTGKYSKDRELSTNEKLALKEIITAFESLESKPNF